MPLCDFESGAVVLDDVRMIHRNVVRALLEIGDRIPAGFHSFGDQTVGFHDRSLRIVDKTRLIRAPLLHEPFAVARIQRVNFQLLDALFAPLQFGLSAPLSSRFPG
jgi:hypothetical protein